MIEQEKLTKCPLCKSGLFLNYKKVKDHAISKEEFLLCQCRECKLIFTNPRPDKKHIQKYYQSESYISHQDQAKGITDHLYGFVRKINIQSKLRLIKKLNGQKGSLLDYGCGTGQFLNKAKEHGWKVEGIEPNKKARNISKRNNVETFKNLDSLQEHKKYDIITLFHVLEHVHSLRKTTKKLINHLEENGHLIIAVPNHNAWDQKHYDENWAAYDVPRHLYHFSKEVIYNFAKIFKLEIVGMKPMSFDSFYISLKSEEYKNPNNHKIKTFWNGFYKGVRSNFWAVQNEKNYSSILIILKKK